MEIFQIIICLVFVGICIRLSSGVKIRKSFGYKYNKIIDEKNVSIRREIPTNKDIYYANVLIKINKLGYKKSNIFGAIILKWVKEGKISFRTENSGLFNKKISIIDMTKDVTFEYEAEAQLYNIMKKASVDGMLETKELIKWCKNNYYDFFKVLDRFFNDTFRLLEYDGHIYKTKSDDFERILDDSIYNDSVQLYGLKKYLEEFSRINTKEVMEVKLWDEYLMFAYLFGNADKITKQLKGMYPEVAEQIKSYNIDVDTLDFVNHISTRSLSAANNARGSSGDYSSGGGGSSSSGGGGGSSGGGGGGSR